MKFLIINNFYVPYERGGAERVVRLTAEGLVGRGHEVVVLTAGPRRCGLWPREEKIGGVRVFRFFPLNLYFAGDAARWPAFLRLKARSFELVNPHPEAAVRALIRKEKPDFVFTHNLAGLGFRIPAAIRKERLPHCHVLHDVQLIHPSGLLLWGKEKEMEARILRAWYERAARRLMGSPDIVISPSKWLLEFHLSRGFFKNSKTFVFPNPVSIPSGFLLSHSSVYGTEKRLPSSESPLSHSSVYGTNKNQSHSSVYGTKRIRLFYAGQLERHKGVEWLIDAVLGAGRERGDITLEIAGAGSLEKYVRESAEKNPEKIVFLGKFVRDGLFRKFGEVSALVVPSLCYENAPQIISEAQSAGLPVLASRIGGIPEMVRDGENGFLFEPGSVEEFWRAVGKLAGLGPFCGETMTADNYLERLLKLCAPAIAKPVSIFQK